MEIRDFFSEKEIAAMKERIIRESCLSRFLVDTEYTDQDGTKERYRSVAPDIKRVIEEETVKQVREYVREVVNMVAKERVAAAVDRFLSRLCEQLEM